MMGAPFADFLAGDGGSDFRTGGGGDAAGGGAGAAAGALARSCAAGA